MKINFLFLIVSLFFLYSCKDQVVQTNNKQLKLLSPNGGETLNADSACNIKWQSKNIDKINIYYSLDNGIKWEIIAKDIISSEGLYLWTIPDTITTKGLVKISSNDNSVSDKSDGSFIISKIYSLRLLFPNGGETLMVDSTYNINWESQGINKISISYTTDNGTFWKTLGENIDALNKQFPWKIPNTITDSGLIKITSSNSSVEDVSDFNFKIAYSVNEMFKYYPLNVGDIWIYNDSVEQFSWTELRISHYIVKKEILKDSLINGEKFFLVKEKYIKKDTTLNSRYPIETWQRIDKNSGMLQKMSIGNNNINNWLKITMKTGEVIENGAPSSSEWYRLEVLSENKTELFGISTEVKKYKKIQLFQAYQYEFAKNIGQIRYILYGENMNADLILKGAVLNGVAIGDTTTQ